MQLKSGDVVLGSGALVDGDRGVVTPEDPYPVWAGPGGPALIGSRTRDRQLMRVIWNWVVRSTGVYGSWLPR